MTSKQFYSLLSIVISSFLIISISGFAKSPAIQNMVVELKATRDTVPAVDSTERKIYEVVEVEAYFPGGEQSWRSYLEQNLNPMVPITNKAPAGMYTVYVQFVVDLDGKVSAIKALTKHGYGMEAEVMRILRKSPPWVPAVQHGKKVRAYRKQPVTFQVEEEKKKKRRKDD